MFTDKSSSPVKTALDEETRSVEKAPDSRLKKLLPILVVILLLIGLIAALLSSFFLPGTPGNGDTGKEHMVVEIRLTAVNTILHSTNLSVTRSHNGEHDRFLAKG